MSGNGNDDFEARRQQTRDALASRNRDDTEDATARGTFFKDVYTQAGGDAARVPWADMKPKDQLVQWLAQNAGIKIASGSSAGPRAIDIACGLGDNAEAIAAAGYRTVAFDLSAEAIGWARQRFPGSTVDYRVADLFDPPGEWLGAFDLVHECFTLQALPPDMLERTATAIAALAAPGADLIVYTRWRPDGAPADGPPWPLEEARLDLFAPLGFDTVSETRFEMQRPDGRVIPHAFRHWRRR